MNDTIAAIATGHQATAIGILRLSGPQAISALDQVFTPANGKPMAEQPNRLLVYGTLHDAQGNALDHCLATVSRGPHSYTGEDTAELQCHGSPVLLTMALEALFGCGVRQAQAGEFTRRAFLAGKMDLTRTEAVADLIHAETQGAVYQAAGQLGGALAQVIEDIYHQLTALMAHFHAVLDYPDEDIDPFEAQEIADTLGQTEKQLDQLTATYQRGKALVEGIPCAIVGKPNAGKSTLFNALLGYDRAIVTPIAGTTRDTVEERLNLGGALLRLIDTAGLRDSDDQVEQLGVERSREALRRSELTLVVVDASRPRDQEEEELLQLAARNGPTILVYNKEDLPSAAPLSAPPAGVETVTLSALTGDGIDQLELAIGRLFPHDPGLRPGALLTNARQAQAAAQARDCLTRAQLALQAGLSPDAVLTDVEDALQYLGQLTGRVVRDDITSQIFQRFCVGK